MYAVTIVWIVVLNTLFNYIYRENWCSYAYIHYKIKKTIFQIEPHSLLFIAKKTVSDTISYRTCSAGISFVLLCYLLPVVQKIIYTFIRVDIGGRFGGCSNLLRGRSVQTGTLNFCGVLHLQIHFPGSIFSLATRILEVSRKKMKTKVSKSLQYNIYKGVLYFW